MDGASAPHLQRIGVSPPGNRRSPSGHAFGRRRLQGRGAFVHARGPGHSAPRPEPPLGEQELWQPLQSGRGAGGQVPASLRSHPPVFAPSLPLNLCSSRLPLQGDAELTGHLPCARDGGAASQELACSRGAMWAHARAGPSFSSNSFRLRGTHSLLHLRPLPSQGSQLARSSLVAKNQNRTMLGLIQL